ncbi:hypothetical protein LCGC14_0495130 [marine sediment metagenome]|uniref:Uncharacterized protein n=1 Tax=marine sediment metagenome TaxID=412755 RepID=A0A0F9USE0_9ZZZZ
MMTLELNGKISEDCIYFDELSGGCDTYGTPNCKKCPNYKKRSKNK